MFTGIIERLGVLTGRRPVAGGARLDIAPERPYDDLVVGESIAINGACLTVEPDSTPGRLVFFTSGETLQRTTLGSLRNGAPLNLERALRPADRLGGHIVLGHVDAVGAIRRFDRTGESWHLEVGFPPELAPLLAAKGSVAVDGISLTLVDADRDAFSVAVIPQTVERTNLRAAGPGAAVNLEADVMARYVLRALQSLREAGGLSTDLLGRAGFLDS